MKKNKFVAITFLISSIYAQQAKKVTTIAELTGDKIENATIDISIEGKQGNEITLAPQFVNCTFNQKVSHVIFSQKIEKCTFKDLNNVHFDKSYNDITVPEQNLANITVNNTSGQRTPINAASNSALRGQSAVWKLPTP